MRQTNHFSNINASPGRDRENFHSLSPKSRLMDTETKNFGDLCNPSFHKLSALIKQQRFGQSMSYNRKKSAYSKEIFETIKVSNFESSSCRISRFCLCEDVATQWRFDTFIIYTLSFRYHLSLSQTKYLCQTMKNQSELNNFIITNSQISNNTIHFALDDDEYVNIIESQEFSIEDTIFESGLISIQPPRLSFYLPHLNATRRAKLTNADIISIIEDQDRSRVIVKISESIQLKKELKLLSQTNQTEQFATVFKNFLQLKILILPKPPSRQKRSFDSQKVFRQVVQDLACVEIFTFIPSTILITDQTNVVRSFHLTLKQFYELAVAFTLKSPEIILYQFRITSLDAGITIQNFDSLTSQSLQFSKGAMRSSLDCSTIFKSITSRAYQQQNFQGYYLSVQPPKLGLYKPLVATLSPIDQQDSINLLYEYNFNVTILLK